MTRWTPDTCGCVIDMIDWDAGTGKTVSACPAHVGLVDDAHVAVVYKGENFVKNMALADLAAEAPTLFWSPADARARNEAALLAALGTPTARQRQLVQALSTEDADQALRSLGLTPIVAGQPLPGVTVGWAFRAGAPGQARVLEVTCAALTAAERTAVQARVARFGPGRVHVV